METFDALLKALAFHPNGECSDSAVAQAALRHAIGAFVSTATSGEPEELHGFAKQIFVAIPDKRPTPTADAWVTALETLAMAAQRLYERTAPKKEAMDLLKQPRVLEALRTLSNRGRVRARELRHVVGIEYQSNLARLMRKLVQVGLVSISRGQDNSAWYRLTFAGRQLAREHFGSQPSVRLKSKEVSGPEVRKQDLEIVPDDTKIENLRALIRELVTELRLAREKEPEGTKLKKSEQYRFPLSNTFPAQKATATYPQFSFEEQYRFPSNTFSTHKSH